MAWPKGKPRPKGAGRQPGSKNKITMYRPTLEDQCTARGINVFELLLDYCGPGEPALRLKALEIIMKYLHPQKRAIDHSGSIEVNPYLDQPIEVLIPMVKERLKLK